METAQHNNLSICSFNCRSLKSSLVDVHELCDRYDIILLQEHWLLPNELNCLNNVHCDFISVGRPAIDISNKLLVGRSYGGTAILYRRNLAKYISPVSTQDPRISAVVFNTNIGPMLLCCVYMPVDYGDFDCVESYTATCSVIDSLISEVDAVHVVIAGDFNCQPGSRFFDTLTHLATDNNLTFTDIDHLSTGEVFTYCNDAGSRVSWIDHVLCSASENDLVSNVEVLYSYVTSDHKPIVTTLVNLLICDDDSSLPNKDKIGVNNVYCPGWSKAGDSHYSMYKMHLMMP